MRSEPRVASWANERAASAALFQSWSVPGSNRRPSACKADALPAELTPRAGRLYRASRRPLDYGGRLDACEDAARGSGSPGEPLFLACLLDDHVAVSEAEQRACLA